MKKESCIVSPAYRLSGFIEAPDRSDRCLCDGRAGAGAGGPQWREFLRESWMDPLKVGAVAPTSARLAERLVDTAAVAAASKIIELGPGTGAVTEQIMEKKSAAAEVLAIEHHGAFSSELRRRFPALQVVCGCVDGLQVHAAKAGFNQADCIVSTLPWTIFPEERQAGVLASSRHLLAEHGTFCTIACFGLHLTGAGRRFRQLLSLTFGNVRASSVSWFNIPPAFVYRCTK